MCNCLEKLTQSVRESYKDPKAFVESSTTLIQGKFARIPSGMVCRYRKTMKDGAHAKQLTKVELMMNFCPICGTKY